MHIVRSVLIAAAVLGLVACGNKDEDDAPPIAPSAPPSVAPAADPTPTPSAPTDLKVEQPKNIEARVKAELDNRADGITGSALAVPGARASMQVPTGWSTTKSGEFNVAAPADKKAQIAAAALGASEGVTAKLPAAVTALGLSGCEWGNAESVTLGKSKVTATAADGVCMQGSTQVRAAYVAPQAEGLLAVGAWEPSGDSAGVFGSMRSITKTGTGTGDSSGIGACCSALRQNANSAPPEQKGALISAAAACDALRSNPQGRAALAQVRALLLGANVPASCR